MEQLWFLLKNVDFRHLIWIIPLVHMLHELEEWNIMKWYKSTYTDLPGSTASSIRLWLIIVSVIGFIYTAVPFYIGNLSAAAYLIEVFVIYTTFNGCQHIYWTFAFRKYSPGVIFSSIGILCGILVTLKALGESYVNPVAATVLYLLIIPKMLETVKAENTMVKEIRAIHELSLKIENKLKHVTGCR